MGRGGGGGFSRLNSNGGRRGLGRQQKVVGEGLIGWEGRQGKAKHSIRGEEE